MRIEAAGELFFTYLQHERGCSSGTATAYRADVTALLRYLGEEGIAPDIEALTPQVLRQYVAWMGEMGEGV